MPVPLVQESLNRSLLRDEVFERLRDAIVAGTLGPGEQLRDGELATWLGVSRTPVREALLRLQQAGLVTSVPGRSTVVAPLEVRTVREAQSVVAALHEVAVREAVGRMTRDDLRRMRAANKAFAAAVRARDAEAAIAADDELHGIPVLASGNAAVRAVLEQYTPVLRRAERLRFSSATGRGSVSLHDELIARCAAGDADGAAAVSTRTWQSLTLTPDPADPADPDDPGAP